MSLATALLRSATTVSVSARGSAGVAAKRLYGAHAHATHAPSSAFSFDNSLACAPGTQITTLTNGLRVATQSTHHGSATVGVYIDAGSRFETDETSGTANFAEHMLFKGKEAEADALGAELGAYTTRELTAFYARTSAEDASKALALLGECVTAPKVDAGVMDKEREAILRQMQAADQNMEGVVFDNLHATAYQGTAMARSVLGPSAHVTSLTAQDLVNYIKTNFVPNRMVIAAAGGVSHDAVVKAAEQAFGKLTPGAAAKVSHPRFTGSEIRLRDDEMPLAHVGLAFQGVGASHPHYFILEVARAIIGSWDAGFQFANHRASNLVSEIIEDHVSAVTFRAFNHTYSDTGLWGAYMAADRLSVDDAMHELQSEMVRICLASTDADLIRAKAALKTEFLSAIAGTPEACDDIGRSVVSYGRHMSNAERLARIDAVTVADVRSVLTHYIYDKCPALTAVGPVEAVWDYNRIRSGMYWLRA